LFLLRSRVEDEVIRDSTVGFIEQCGVATGTASTSTADEALGRAAEFARDATERAGGLIRATFERG
jgi:hypothetical protein